MIEFTKNNTFRTSNRLENSFVSQCIFPALHNKSEPVVNALMSLLLRNSTKRTNPSLAFFMIRLVHTHILIDEEEILTVFFAATMVDSGEEKLRRRRLEEANCVDGGEQTQKCVEGFEYIN